MKDNNHFGEYKAVYFIGAGGIGMSAIARYFISRGLVVAGYDRTPSELTRRLEKEGMLLHYEESVADIPHACKDPQHCLVVYTPAIPAEHKELVFFRENGFEIEKRAEVLGTLTRQMHGLCVAGTHGKTTTSTMCAHILHQSHLDCNAFLGGIAKNYGTNYILSQTSDFVVIEADEYDRSFHHLTPYISVITAVDPDHLDIYGTAEAYREAFAHYTSLISGALVMKQGIALEPRLQPGVKCYTYGWDNAHNIRIGDGQLMFDYVSPLATIRDIRLGVPVWVNIENAVAAITVALLVGVPEEQIKERMASFRGVLRRFNIHVNTPRVAYVDDYAHHPEEIATAIDSIRRLYPERRLIGVFQPHLYTRTRDFADGFRRVLATLDECMLLPIYPARELPIPGVTSEMLIERTREGDERMKVVEKTALINELKKHVAESPSPVVILTVGAGDIDRLVPAITEALK